MGWQQRIVFPNGVQSWAGLLDRNKGWPQFREGMRRLIDALVGKGDFEEVIRYYLHSARDREPWMLDIIQHGEVLLRGSSTKKVQNYYAEGVFIFHMSNWNQEDILLGSIATLRNSLISRLLERAGDRWIMRPECPAVRAGDENTTVYFKGHDIILTREGGNDDAMFCRFECKRLVVGEIPKSESGDVSIPYPPDADLKTFQGSLNQALETVPPPCVVSLLRELSEACNEL